jgi:hypothetical protein
MPEPPLNSRTFVHPRDILGIDLQSSLILSEVPLGTINACGTRKRPNIKTGDTETSAASGVLILGDEYPVCIV